MCFDVSIIINKALMTQTFVTVATKDFIYYLIRELPCILQNDARTLTKRKAAQEATLHRKDFLNPLSKVCFRWAFQDRALLPRAEQSFISPRNP